jgi:hypothetical protein
MGRAYKLEKQIRQIKSETKYAKYIKKVFITEVT